MTKKNPFNIFVISGLAYGLTACGHIGTTKIIEEEQSQIALLLNKNLTFTAVGLNNGKRAKPCELETNSDPEGDKSSSGAAAHTNQRLPDARCKIVGRENPFYSATYTITVVKGSCCAYIEGPGVTEKMCSPPHGEYPIEFIHSIGGQSIDGQCK